MKSKIYILVWLASLHMQSSCKKFLGVDAPHNKLITATVFQNDVSAESAMMGIYANMAYGGGPVSGSLYGTSLIAGLSADEFILIEDFSEIREFNDNEIVAGNSLISITWNEYYRMIYGCNALMEGLSGSSGLRPALVKQLNGEAKFIRAFIHFYLVNQFGRIPYITTTNYEENTIAQKMDIPAVYEHIIKDLQEAIELLPEDYAAYNGLRSRPNKYAAWALLARAYLYNKDYESAESAASMVIDRPEFKLEPLDDVFLTGSREAIWRLEAREGLHYTSEGGYFSGETRMYQTMTDELLASFDPADDRLNKWVLAYTHTNGMPMHTPNKYKDNSTNASSLREATAMIRLAEIYLIRAEARAMLDKLTGTNGASSDLDEVRGRAGLTNTTSTTQDGLLEDILEERRHELFSEWGHRWFDLKRSGKADAVMGAVKATWQATDQLYPIPRQETLTNPNMKQNEGYN